MDAPKRNIPKILAFVILVSFICIWLAGCGSGSANSFSPDQTAQYDAPKITGRISSDDITESSGIAASKCQQDVFWTHNDSGDDAFVFAINSKGEHLGTWRVTGATNKDWEAIAERKDPDGKCYLYIGEIGNNRLEREEMGIYRIAEPKVDGSAANSSRKEPLETEPSTLMSFRYPDMRHDAETLLVHPVTGDIYVLTKSKSEASGVHKLEPQFDGTVHIAKKIADVTVPAVPYGLLTGGDISNDGKRIVLCDDFAGYELTLPDAAKDFDEIWKQKPLKFDIGKRQAGEAVTYAADGTSVFATSEKKNSPVFQTTRLSK